MTTSGLSDQTKPTMLTLKLEVMLNNSNAGRIAPNGLEQPVLHGWKLAKMKPAGGLHFGWSPPVGFISPHGYMILLTTIWPFWYSLLTYLLIALCLSTDVRHCHVFVILYVWYLPYAYIHFYSPQYHSSYSSQSVYFMFCVRWPCYMPWYESKRKRIPKRYLLEYPILSWDIYDFHVDSMHLIHTS